MDGRGSCCIARYTGGAYDLSKVNRIMLRFRPIAPKPATSGSVSGGSTPEKNEVYVKNGRPKRRYVRHTNNNNNKSKRRYNRKRNSSPKEPDTPSDKISGGSDSGRETIVTLPLLPETPDPKEISGIGPPSNTPIWLNLNGNDSHVTLGVGHVTVGLDRTVWMSTVTVERVTDTWVGGGDVLGNCTDEERRMNLERDTCPGFISDGLDGVVWTNGAYREMVGQGGIVRLVMEERVAVIWRAFTCRVRVEYCDNMTMEEKVRVLRMPCDAWRMEGGGFAWRLDVKAALSLGW
ncbi:uncharacterized protein LOC132283905 [Cornus florida]|uniref:uncharacterized protein LOC132283905 n=1 Tax=Cornus florida TaxID=4283 RepID=UPI0028987F9B|nr:uncharacterized protein LOC132283905 [Cornus florida]